MSPELPLTPQSWGLLGLALTIVVWVVYALLRGNLVSRRVVDERVKDWEARLAQAVENSQFWKEAAEAYRTANAELIPMVKNVAENGETVLSILRAMKAAVEARHED